MDFRNPVALGRTGRQVSRLGLASGYGVPAEAIERAFHEHGINYLYVSPLVNQRSMIRAVRNLAPRHREELTIVQARPLLRALRLERYVDRWLSRLGLEWLDLMFQAMRKPMSPRLLDRLHRLRERGKVRLVGLSSHDRRFLGGIARSEVRAPVDLFHARYNAVHTGAERDVFPHLRPGDRPGVVIFTATCWRKLLKPTGLPAGERPLTAAECYRFVLSHPDVDVCLMGPSSAEGLDANLQALDDGPLDEQEMARVRRIGRQLHGR